LHYQGSYNAVTRQLTLIKLYKVAKPSDALKDDTILLAPATYLGAACACDAHKQIINGVAQEVIHCAVLKDGKCNCSAYNHADYAGAGAHTKGDTAYKCDCGAIVAGYQSPDGDKIEKRKDGMLEITLDGQETVLAVITAESGDDTFRFKVGGVAYEGIIDDFNGEDGDLDDGGNEISISVDETPYIADDDDFKLMNVCACVIEDGCDVWVFGDEPHCFYNETRWNCNCSSPSAKALDHYAACAGTVVAGECTCAYQAGEANAVKCADVKTIAEHDYTDANWDQKCDVCALANACDHMDGEDWVVDAEGETCTCSTCGAVRSFVDQVGGGDELDEPNGFDDVCGAKWNESPVFD
jgi:hypothetical protein